MSVYLVRRETKKGIKWHLRAELTDPALGIQHLVHKKDGTTVMEHRLCLHLGVFETKELANLARERALRDIAEGRTPKRFAEIPATPAETSLRDAANHWLTTLHDVADSTIESYQDGVNSIPEWLALKSPDAVTFKDIQTLVTEYAERLQRGTIGNKLTVLGMILDQHGVNNNPVRDKRVRLPRKQRKVYRLPSRADIEILHRILPSRVELLTLLEHTGLRIHEAHALRWEDIDYERDRLLIADSKTSAGVRFVERLPESPGWPVRRLGASGRVFFKPTAGSLTSVLRAAHVNHGAPLYSAHDFRHLHASRLLHYGILSPAQIAARLGHSNPGITLSTYSHVIPPD